MIENLFWTGDPPQEWPENLGEFLRQGDLPGRRVSWWIEPAFLGGDSLYITYELSTEDPLRVRPYQWVHFDGARYGLGRRKGGKDA